jgi:hypothetical protein
MVALRASTSQLECGFHYHHQSDRSGLVRRDCWVNFLLADSPLCESSGVSKPVCASLKLLPIDPVHRKKNAPQPKLEGVFSGAILLLRRRRVCRTAGASTCRPCSYCAFIIKALRRINEMRCDITSKNDTNDGFVLQKFCKYGLLKIVKFLWFKYMKNILHVL